MKRYRLIGYSGCVVASADRVCEYLDGRNHGMVEWHVLDSRTGRLISPEEFREILSRIAARA
jgi:hypothetical protein